MTIEERLESLERGLSAAKRRNKYLLIGLVLLAVAWALTSATGTVQAQAGENIIRAERFELVDSQGRVRGVLSATDDGAGLYLYDENGKGCATLCVSDELGPGLAVCDANGTSRAMLDVLDGDPELVLYRADGTGRAGQTVLDRAAGLGLFRWDERPIWSAP